MTSTTTWAGDIELLGDIIFDVSDGNILILSGAVDVSSGVNFNSSGAVTISGNIAGSGNLNATNGVTDLSGDNTAFTGKIYVGLAELSMSSDQGLGSVTEISVETGGTLNLNDYTPQDLDVAPQNFDEFTPQNFDIVPHNFASFASFALPSKLKKIPLKLAALTKVKAGLKKLG